MIIFWFCTCSLSCILIDGFHGSLKAKRARAAQVKHKSTINLFNKISDMIEKLAELVDIQELTDTTILQVNTH